MDTYHATRREMRGLPPEDYTMKAMDALKSLWFGLPKPARYFAIAVAVIVVVSLVYPDAF